MDKATDLKLWYDRPATVFTESLPLGNGRLGAMVFGGIDAELIVLNESSAWSGSRQDADRPDAHKSLPEIRRLLLAGRNAEAQELIMKTFTCSGVGSKRAQGAHVPFGCFQTLGELRLQFTDGGAAACDYRRQLDLEQATATVCYSRDGVAFRRECFVSAADQAIVIRLSADRPGKISFDAALSRPEQFATKSAGGDLIMTGQLDNGVDGNGVRYAAVMRAVPLGGEATVDDGALHIRNVDEVLLLVTAATDFQGFAGRNTPDALAAAMEDMNCAADETFDQLKDDHVADYRQLFGRVRLKLKGAGGSAAKAAKLTTDRRLAAMAKGAADPGLMALYFQYGRYLLISSSRPSGLPANLQGLWAQEIQTPWNGDWHLDINVQMNYWPAETCNLSELHMPLMKLIESLQEPGRRTAKAYYDADGWVAHVITNPWGFTSPGESAVWGATTGGSAWLCEHLWEHYAFTLDREYLAWAYPIMAGCAQFYLDLLIEEPTHGWLVTAPSNSPENSFLLPDGAAAQVCMGPTIDMQQLRELFGNCIRASEILDVDEPLRGELAAKRQRLAPNQIGPDGRLQEWLLPYEEREPNHRHVSHLYGLHPYDEITPDETPGLAEAARRSLDGRGDAGTGWSLAWKVSFCARLGDGDHAHKLLADLLRPTTAMGFDYVGGGAGTYPNLFCAHPPFQIDGNFGGSAGIAEMLLQSRWPRQVGQRPAVLLLPALPRAWPTGKVEGLRSRGAITVDIEWRDGRLVRARLRPDRDTPIRVICGGKAIDIELKHGRASLVRPADFL